MTVQYAYYPLAGGEDLIAPALSADPGKARITRNYELDKYGRYRRIDGYERFDGRPSPSDASYWILDFDAGNNAITAGDTVTGHSSSAYGELVEQVLESGSYIVGDAAGYLVLTGVSGTFQNDEPLQVSAVTKATSASTATENGADTDALHYSYQQAAIEEVRDNISAVPGSGSLLGIWQYNGIKYAFRNNAGGTAGAMYKSSTSGWTACDLGRSVAFTSGGTTEIAVNDVVTGATSAATATVKRVILTSGTWAGGNAAGTLILYSQSGTFQAENLDVGAVLNLATIAGNSTANTLAAGGKYEFVTFNFGGHAGTRRMYGCNGVSKAFEWDGSVFVPITTGMTADTPEHIFAHRGRLFLSFSGGSLQCSSLNSPPATVAPYIWSVVTDAAEFGLGDEITKIFGLPGGVLGVKARNSTWALYGSSSDDWDLKPISTEAGAVEWSGQFVNGRFVSLDDRGLSFLEAVQEYGDFSDSTISEGIDPYLKTKITSVVCSMAVKDKSQYRLFFSDGAGIYMTMSGSKVIGFTRVQFDDIPTCCCAAENSTGVEELFFGDSSGYVYQLDSGTSFDGGAIEAFVKTHYNHMKSPQRKKRILKVNLEADAPINTAISMHIEFDYGGSNPNSIQDFDVTPSGGLWDVDSWEAFVWDSVDVSTAEAYVDGSGYNFSILFYSNLTYVDPHTLQGVTIPYILRGNQK